MTEYGDAVDYVMDVDNIFVGSTDFQDAGENFLMDELREGFSRNVLKHQTILHSNPRAINAPRTTSPPLPRAHRGHHLPDRNWDLGKCDAMLYIF